MDPDRIHAALARIETAAERIALNVRERALDTGNPELAARYERLREEAGAALAQLDQLILELEQ